MARKRLSEKEIDQLLGQYRSERRRMMFQLDIVRKTIKELKQLLKGAKRAAVAKGDPGAMPMKRGPGRPRKYPAGQAPPPRRRGRKPGRKASRKGMLYRLNDWDNAVIAIIRDKQLLMPRTDVLVELKKWAERNQPGTKAVEVEAMLTRTLQKLTADQRALGAHHTGLVRGNHYGLKEWFFASSGKLRRKHLSKLVITDKER